jgi:hypothetical protein
MGAGWAFNALGWAVLKAGLSLHMNKIGHKLLMLIFVQNRASRFHWCFISLTKYKNYEIRRVVRGL